MKTDIPQTSLNPTPSLAANSTSLDWDVIADKTTAQVVKRLADYQPTCLEGLKTVALQDRTDTKVIFSTQQLLQVLNWLSDHYRVLEIAGVRVHSYQNLYFDTPGLALYEQHHRGLRPGESLMKTGPES